MAEIHVLQTDNRPVDGSVAYPFDYMAKSVAANRKVCLAAGFHYHYVPMPAEYYAHNHPAGGKLYVVRDWLKDELAKDTHMSAPKVLVFLDTDAWVQSAMRVHVCARMMLEQGKRGAFSRDPYFKKNTYINSGSFMLKVDASAVQMYEEILGQVTPETLSQFPWDQTFVSDYVWRHHNEFLVFAPHWMNTGHGWMLRHNWVKTSRKLRDDLWYIGAHPVDVWPLGSRPRVEQSFVDEMAAALDSRPFPNESETDYDYMDFA